MTDDCLLLDSGYVRDEFCAIYAYIVAGRVMLIESSTNAGIDRALESLYQRTGLGADAVDGLMITHVHLDHAGGAGRLLQLAPKAKLYAHPRAARHAIDPAKLVLGATAVYGEELFKKLYGEIVPCPADRVVITEHESKFSWGGKSFQFFHTRGHANHHQCIFEEGSRTLFAGDSFGVSYPGATVEGRLFTPSTSPTDFDADAARETVRFISELGPARVGLTHMGWLEGEAAVRKAADQLKFFLSFSEYDQKRFQNDPSFTEAECVELQWEGIQGAAQRFGYTLSPEARAILDLDLRVNAQGLRHAAHR
jgi:glyoxylase-like metal-dependent hydrolase (beta-lactamase superfamily II)